MGTRLPMAHGEVSLRVVVARALLPHGRKGCWPRKVEVRPPMEMAYLGLVRAHPSPAIALVMTLLGFLGPLVRSLAMVVQVPRFGTAPYRPR